MCTFIAHTISFDKDFKNYRLKGGDNNVHPRPDNWTRDIPIGELIKDLDGRTVKLTTGNAKHQQIYKHLAEAQKKYDDHFKHFAHLPSYENCIWGFSYIANKEPVSDEDKQFYTSICEEFISKLRGRSGAAAVTYVAPSVSQIRLL